MARVHNLTAAGKSALKEARESGAKRYFSGSPCAKGHIAERFVSTRACVVCANINAVKWQNNNKDRLAKKARRWRSENKERCFNNTLLLKYKITSEEYFEILKRQNGVCAICKKPEDGNRKRSLCVDHCHKDGHVRGILCGLCNTALGYFKDDISSIDAAAEYLRITRGR